MLFLWYYIEDGSCLQFNKLKLSICTSRSIFGSDNFYELLYITKPNISFERKRLSLFPSKNFIFNVLKEPLDIMEYWRKQQKFIDTILVSDILFKTNPMFERPMCEKDEYGIKYCFKTDNITNDDFSVRISHSQCNASFHASGVEFWA